MQTSKQIMKTSFMVQDLLCAVPVCARVCIVLAWLAVVNTTVKWGERQGLYKKKMKLFNILKSSGFQRKWNLLKTEMLDNTESRH